MTQAPREIYRARVASGDLEHDDAQWHALGHLDELHHTLTQTRDEQGWLGKRLGRLFGAAPEVVTGCYMWGGVGTGKTLLMDVFCASLPAERTTRTHFHRFMRDIHERKSKVRDQTDPLSVIAEQIAVECDVLCLDEFTVSDITDAMIMHGLLRHLFQSRVVLVTTSNSRIQDLYRDGLQRARFLPAIELLEKHTHSINVDGGKDYRLDYLTHSSIYHCPADEGARIAMRELFDHLVGPVSASTGPLEINGRKVHTLKSASGVVWFEFDELCQTNRSNSDYIELARQFHTVMLSDVPQMNRELEDPARRFIELVDELYDRKANFIMSSNHLPHQLYSGKRLASAFERTASRLVEMGSEEYLSLPHAG